MWKSKYDNIVHKLFLTQQVTEMVSRFLELLQNWVDVRKSIHDLLPFLRTYDSHMTR